MSQYARCKETVRRFSNGCHLGLRTTWWDSRGVCVVCVEVCTCAWGRMLSAFGPGGGCFERLRQVRDETYNGYQLLVLLFGHGILGTL